ncbi:MAG: ribosome small subunit-dependent GTPase A [Bacteroidales bacterium]|nr:ribosome small subunit-dependent GTPase A [Bacteroidales bacterium]
MERGLVIKSTGSYYTVQTDGNGCVTCQLKGRLRTGDIDSTNPVTVGDRVILESADGNRLICDIESRKNYLIRKSANLSKRSHIIAANVDMALPVVTLRMPETPPEFIDRFLVSAEAYRIPVCILFNKTDLYSAEETGKMLQMADVYRRIGYSALETSATTKRGIDALRQMLKGKISVMAGLSGAGKSSLIRAVDPSLQPKVGDMSEYHRSGKHTTTFSEMLPVCGGGYVIDTPGIKGFGLIHIEKQELYHFFPEIFKVAERCAFHNCLHVREPDCAVTEAVSKGEISAGRYRSYLNMMEDVHSKYR